MKRSYKWLIMSVLIFSFLGTTIIQAAEVQPANTIQVSGKAIIKVKPDVAYISAKIRTENKDAQIAQEENARIVDRIKKDLKEKYNLQGEDINTSYYNVGPSYDYVEGKQIFRAYIAEHSLSIKLEEIQKVGEVSDALVKGGATSINHIKFDIIDSNATYNMALQQAMENARSKSNAITKALGVQDAKPISIVEQSSSAGIIEREMNLKMADAVTGMTPTAIEQNEIEVTAQVAVTFQW